MRPISQAEAWRLVRAMWPRRDWLTCVLDHDGDWVCTFRDTEGCDNRWYIFGHPFYVRKYLADYKGWRLSEELNPMIA